MSYQTNYYCDRCGAAISIDRNMLEFKGGPLYQEGVRFFDMCKECAHSFRDWMATGATSNSAEVKASVGAVTG